MVNQYDFKDLSKQQNYVPKIELELNNSSVKKASSFNNWDKMYINIASEDTIFDNHYMELKEMLLQKTSEEISIPSCIAIEKKFKYFLQINYSHPENEQSRFNRVIGVMDCIAKTTFNECNYLQLLRNTDFLMAVLTELNKSVKPSTYKRRCVVLKNFYKFYFQEIGCSIFDSECPMLLKLIDQSTVKAPKIMKEKNYTSHPFVEEFVSYLKDEKNERWFKDTRYRINPFLRWLVKDQYIDGPFNQANVKKINEEMLIKYRKHLELRVLNNEIKADYAALIITSIKRWFTFLREKGHILKNPATRIKRFKGRSKRNFRLLRLEEVEMFFNAILEHGGPFALRDFTLFCTIAGLGARASEILNIKQFDIDFSLGQVKLLRKGLKEQILPLPGIVLLMLELHVKSIPENQSFTTIWTNQMGNQMNYDNVRRKFHKYMKLAGLTERVGACHFFRHLLISELCLQDTELLVVQKIAGHSSIKELDTYVHGRQESVLNNFKNKFQTTGSDIYGC